MVIWEYHKSLGDGDLEVLGRAGWELVAVVPSTGEEAAFYFKRPAPGFRERVTNDQKRHYYTLLGIKGPEEKV